MSGSTEAKRAISKNKNRFINLAVMLVSTTLCLFFLEIVLRSIVPHELYSSLVPTPKTERHNGYANFFPNIDSVTHFSVNEYGYRSSSFFDPQRYGILTVGGSTTYCISLSDDETWPWVLEKRLNSTAINRDFTVGNIGVPAFNAGNHWHQINKIESQFENIKMVIMLVGVNDFARVLFLNDNYFPTSADEHLYNRTFVRLPRTGKSKWFERTEIYMHVRDAYHAYKSTKSQRYTPERLDRLLKDYEAASKTNSLPDSLIAVALNDYESNLRNIVRLTRERNLKLVLITQPVLWHEGMGAFEEKISSMGAPVIDGMAYSPKVLAKGMAAFNQKLTDVAQSEGVYLIDLAEKLPQDTTVFFDWCHYNKRGASMIADLLFEELGPLIQQDLVFNSQSLLNPISRLNDQP